MAYLASLALAFLMPSDAPAVEAPNLRPNPGFELDENHDSRPDGWSFTWEFTHSNDKQRGLRKQQPQFRWEDTAAVDRDTPLEPESIRLLVWNRQWGSSRRPPSRSVVMSPGE